MVDVGRRPDREGSIPMVLGMTLVLATLGAAALTMTGTLNRTERRADLGRKASDVARIASEEVLVKLMNGAGSWTVPESGKPSTRVQIPPSSTQAIYAEKGIRVAPVEVMGRPLEEQGFDRKKRDQFYGMLSAGPVFARNHDPAWEQRSTIDPRLKALMKPPAGVTPDPVTRDALVAELAGKELDPEDDVATAFRNADQPGGGDVGLVENLAEASEEVSDAAADATCGNIAPDVALVSILSSMTRNETVDPDDDREEFNETQQLMEGGGILLKQNYLLTLESKATAPSSGMESTSSHLTHRMVSRLHYGEAMRFAYGRLLGYIHAHMGMTYEDFQRLGMIDATGEIRAEKILPEVEAQITMRPGPQIWPFPVASGPAGSSSGASTPEEEP